MSYNILKIRWIAILILAVLSLCSCQQDEDEYQQIQLTKHQKSFYVENQEFFSQFDQALMTNWISQMEYNSETGELIDSKALLVEEYITSEQFNRLMLILYSSNNTKKVIVYDEENNANEITDPDFTFSKEVRDVHVTHVWKNKKNVPEGGCRFSLFSLCEISDVVVVIH